jgi:hypothetical protein
MMLMHMVIINNSGFYVTEYLPNAIRRIIVTGSVEDRIAFLISVWLCIGAFIVPLLVHAAGLS